MSAEILSATGTDVVMILDNPGGGLDIDKDDHGRRMANFKLKCEGKVKENLTSLPCDTFECTPIKEVFNHYPKRT